MNCPGAIYYTRKGFVTEADETRVLTVVLKHAETDRIRQDRTTSVGDPQKLEDVLLY